MTGSVARARYPCHRSRRPSEFACLRSLRKQQKPDYNPTRSGDLAADGLADRTTGEKICAHPPSTLSPLPASSKRPASNAPRRSHCRPAPHRRRCRSRPARHQGRPRRVAPRHQRRPRRAARRASHDALGNQLPRRPDARRRRHACSVSFDLRWPGSSGSDRLPENPRWPRPPSTVPRSLSRPSHGRPPLLAHCPPTSSRLDLGGGPVQPLICPGLRTKRGLKEERPCRRLTFGLPRPAWTVPPLAMCPKGRAHCRSGSFARRPGRT